MARIRQGILMLEGRDKELAAQLKQQMEDIKRLDFQSAAAFGIATVPLRPFPGSRWSVPAPWRIRM